MKRVKKFAWFPTLVITDILEDDGFEIEFFEHIWLRSYFQYYEPKLTCDYDPSMGGDIFEKDFPIVKKLY